MFTKSNLLVTLFGCLVFNVLGWGIYGGFAADYFESQMQLEVVDAMDPLWISIGTLLMSFALANIYRQLSPGCYSFKNGFNFGLMGRLFCRFWFWVYAVWNHAPDEPRRCNNRFDNCPPVLWSRRRVYRMDL